MPIDDINDMFYDYINDFINSSKLINELQKFNKINEEDFSNAFPYKNNLIHCNTNEYQYFDNYLQNINYKYNIPNHEFQKYMLSIANDIDYMINGPGYDILDVFEKYLRQINQKQYTQVNSFAELFKKDDKIDDEYEIASSMNRHNNIVEIPILYINGNVLDGPPNDIHDTLLQKYSLGENYSNNIKDLSNISLKRLDWDDLNKLQIPAARAMLVDNVIEIIMLYGNCSVQEATNALFQKYKRKVYFLKPLSSRLIRKANV